MGFGDGDVSLGGEVLGRGCVFGDGGYGVVEDF